MSLRERLAGQRILLTGVTGFLGEALLERILSDIPTTRVVVLVRGQGGTSARDRVQELLTRPAFGRLRTDIGAEGVGGLWAGRVEVLEGGLDDIPPLPADLDLVVHCAGDVSFDPPLDDAIDTNLLGSLHVL